MDENTAPRAAVEFLGGQVQESGFRVGVPISCRCPRRVRRGLDATASVGVPYDVRVRESSPGGSYGTPLGRTAPDLRRSRRGFRNRDAWQPREATGSGEMSAFSGRVKAHWSACLCTPSRSHAAPIPYDVRPKLVLEWDGIDKGRSRVATHTDHIVGFATIVLPDCVLIFRISSLTHSGCGKESAANS